MRLAHHERAPEQSLEDYRHDPQAEVARTAPPDSSKVMVHKNVEGFLSEKASSVASEPSGTSVDDLRLRFVLLPDALPRIGKVPKPVLIGRKLAR